MATNREADLVNSGKKSWEWALSRMNIIRKIMDDFGNKRPLEGVKIGISLHITKETSVLCLAASKLGAKNSHFVQQILCPHKMKLQHF